MRILLDENVARPLRDTLRLFIAGRELAHVHELDGWSGTKDLQLYRRAADEGFDVVLTNDDKQMQRRLEVEDALPAGRAW